MAVQDPNTFQQIETGVSVESVAHGFIESPGKVRTCFGYSPISQFVWSAVYNQLDTPFMVYLASAGNPPRAAHTPAFDFFINVAPFQHAIGFQPPTGIDRIASAALTSLGGTIGKVIWTDPTYAPGATQWACQFGASYQTDYSILPDKWNVGGIYGVTLQLDGFGIGNIDVATDSHGNHFPSFGTRCEVWLVSASGVQVLWAAYDFGNKWVTHIGNPATTNGSGSYFVSLDTRQVFGTKEDFSSIIKVFNVDIPVMGDDPHNQPLNINFVINSSLVTPFPP